jgi:hypothetical protein
LKATKFLTDRKLDWHDIVDMLAKPPEPVPPAGNPHSYQYHARPNPYAQAWTPPPQRPATNSIDHTDAACACLTLFNYWNAKEEEFLLDMQDVAWPTQKQLKWLRSLYERYLREIKS